MRARSFGAMALCAVLAGCAAAELPGDLGDEDAGPDAGADAFLPPLARPDATPLRDFGRPRPRMDARAPEPDGGLPGDAAPGVDGEAPADDAAAPPPDMAAPPPDMAAPPPDGGPACAAEVCNGLDDDCDGVADDGRVCGPWVQGHCTLWIGWADERRGPRGTSASWGPCPQVFEHQVGDVRCNSTRRDGNFRVLDLNGDVDDNDQLGFALTCQAADDAALAAWVQTHCALFVGWADNRRGPPEGSPSWLACPGGLQAAQGDDVACTSTGYDGRFRPMFLGGDVDGNDQLGFAWLCQDPADRARAQAMTEAVEVLVGWADSNGGPGNGSPAWGPCPARPAYNDGDLGCTGTRGDGRFHRLDLSGNVNGDDVIGVALRAR